MAEKLSERLERIARGQVWGAGDHETLDEAIELARRVEWRPIETAPKDGAVVLGYSCDATGPVFASMAWCEELGTWALDPTAWGDQSWEWPEVTHWMPLPEPPATEVPDA